MSEASILQKEPADAKGEAIIDAARRVFLANGFDGASMDAIALDANVSKRTVYNRFKSKEALFAATIEETCRRTLPVDLSDIEASADLRGFFRKIARAVLRGLLTPEAVALRRIAMFEAARKPALGAAYLSHGLHFMIDSGEALISKLNARGLTSIEDPRLAICRLGSLVTEPLYAEVLLGAAPQDIEAAIEKQISDGLDAFWKIYGHDAPHGTPTAQPTPGAGWN